MHPAVDRLRGGLIVSCQAGTGDGLYGSDAMAHMALAAQIEDAYMLPFVIVADAHGKFLAGTSGVVAPASLKALLEQHSPGR